MRFVNRQVGAIGSVATMVIGALAVTAVPSWAEAEELAPAACYVQGHGVFQRGDYVEGGVGRYDCGEYVTLTAEIFKHLPAWPDPQIAWNERRLRNGDVNARGLCDGSGNYYIAATSSTGQYDESTRYDLC